MFGLLTCNILVDQCNTELLSTLKPSVGNTVVPLNIPTNSLQIYFFSFKWILLDKIWVDLQAISFYWNGLLLLCSLLIQ